MIRLRSAFRRAIEDDAAWPDMLCSCAVGAVALYLCVRGNMLSVQAEEVRRLFYGTVGASFASVLGFNLTAVSMLALVSENESMRLLKREKPALHARLLKTFFSTVYASLGTAVLALAGLLLVDQLNAALSLMGVASAAAFAVVRLLRSVHRLAAILSLE